MQKNFQVVLDFLVDLKSDKSKVEKLAKDVENILSNINPDINFNSSEAKQAIKDLEDKVYQSRLDELKKFEEVRIKEIEDKYKKEEELLNRFNEIYSSAGEKKISSDKDDGLKKIESDEKARIAELEKWRDMEAISAEEFEKRKG